MDQGDRELVDDGIGGDGQHRQNRQLQGLLLPVGGNRLDESGRPDPLQVDGVRTQDHQGDSEPPPEGYVFPEEENGDQQDEGRGRAHDRVDLGEVPPFVRLGVEDDVEEVDET